MIGEDTVFVQLAGGTVEDRYGTFRRDWDNATSYPVAGASVQPAEGAEDANLDRDARTMRLRVFLPPTPEAKIVEATSRMVVDGTVYEVDGDPLRWMDGGRLDHIEVYLKRVVG